jgi:hypothetical protein
MFSFYPHRHYSNYFSHFQHFIVFFGYYEACFYGSAPLAGSRQFSSDAKIPPTSCCGNQWDFISISSVEGTILGGIHRNGAQQVQFRFRQRHLDIRLVDLHLIVAEGILLDPFVADRIEQEVFQTAEQIDRPVVVAVVSRLHVGVQSIDVGIVDRLQREVLLAIHLPDIFGHVAQQAVVLVGRELCDPGADLLLAFLAVFAEFGQQHPARRGGAQQLFDGKAGRCPVLLDQPVVSGKDRGSITGDDAVDLLVDFVFVERAFETLVPAFRLNLALCIDLGRLTGRSDTGIDRGLALFRDFGLLAEEDNAEGGSWQHGCLVFE